LVPLFAFSPAELEHKKSVLIDANNFIQTLHVTDEATLATADKLCKGLASERKAIEEMRTSLTRPLNAALKTANGWFKPLLELCEGAEAHLKKHEIGRYLAEQRALQEKAYQAAASAHVAGAHAEAQSALAVASSVTTAAPHGTSVREVWRAQVIDPELIPRQYLIPDEPAIQRHARGTPIDQVPEPIPGVRFFKEPIVTVRT